MKTGSPTERFPLLHPNVQELHGERSLNPIRLRDHAGRVDILLPAACQELL